MKNDGPRSQRSAERLAAEEAANLKTSLNRLYPPVDGAPFAGLLKAIEKATRKK